MIEQWREYKNDRFPNYEVSNFGRIRNKFSKNIVSLYTSKFGYSIARLHMGQDKKDYRIHRIVMETFIPNPHNYTDVNHIDGNKSNNHLSNLEWCDRGHNIQHAYDKGLRYRRQVRCIETNDIFTFDNLPAYLIGKRCNILSNISSCCRGKSKSAYGYHFEYIN